MGLPEVESVSIYELMYAWHESLQKSDDGCVMYEMINECFVVFFG